MKLVRAGNIFTSYTSPDNVTWSQIGNAVSIAMASRAYVGLALTSHTTNTLNTARFDNVTVTPVTPPSVTSIVVGDGTAQRSMITRLTVNFDRPVATFDAGAFALSKLGPNGTTVVPTSVVLAPGGESAVLTFTGADVIGGSLADGTYEFAVRPPLVRDLGGGAGTGADQLITFHRLFGDYNGVGGIDSTDSFQFKRALGSFTADANYRWYFDYAADGDVDPADSFQFKKRRPTA